MHTLLEQFIAALKGINHIHALQDKLTAFNHRPKILTSCSNPHIQISNESFSYLEIDYSYCSEIIYKQLEQMIEAFLLSLKELSQYRTLESCDKK